MKKLKVRYKEFILVKNIMENIEIQELLQKHCKEIINSFISKDIDFSIIANISNSSFHPKLPSDLQDNLSKFSIFSLAGYTFKSAHLKDESLCFEAGFGKDNFGSLVKIPLNSIFQIIKDDNIIFINTSATFDNIVKNPKNNSINLFKSNPNNKKFT
ncbi:hypothetical protein CRU89_00670 [Aliarcobacter trophiarum]|nr:hypothetical protein CRU89_00670 [Aliarcobacter trophiarum]